FVAATYLRGVEVVHVPTTLLGAVDASIGGKAGVNLGGKNLVGVFHLPSRVVIDTEILAALPERLRRDGLAEALKAGLIGDPDLVDLLESQGTGAAVDEVVRRAVAVKAAIVAEDPTDRGRRAHLNYGHTIGHAVELASPLTHGEAVAVGMVAAGAAAAGLLGFDAQVRQRSVIEALGLPTTAPGADPEEVRRLLVLDKKRDPSGLRMVLLRRVGEPELVRVGPATVDVALAAVGIA
ncbi:MAG: 3-dehydroquinate synthase family protein, partial [Acidimicrobiia bacterium]